MTLTFTLHLERLATGKHTLGRLSTASHYRSALASFRRFLTSHGLPDLPFEKIDSDLIATYQRHLQEQGMRRNSTSYYMRILRAAYNVAVERGLAEQRHPFRRVYTGVDKTVKRAVPLSAITRIARLDLSAEPRLDYARTMFMLSFCLRGMSFVDMAFLRKSDLSGGRLRYRRRKTGQGIDILWTPEMQRLLDKYPPNPAGYLLPIITCQGADAHNAYRNAMLRVNRALKQVGERAGVGERLTMYVARHSWASGAQSAGVPVEVIRDALGHDSETTTRIYLSTLSTAAVDRANDRLMELISI